MLKTLILGSPQHKAIIDSTCSHSKYYQVKDNKILLLRKGEIIRTIPKNECSSHKKILKLCVELLPKKWVTKEHIRSLIGIACHINHITPPFENELKEPLPDHIK